MIRRRDQHDVHVASVEHAPEIFDRFGRLVSFALHQLDRLGKLLVIHIANHGAVHLGVEKEGRQIALAHTATPDEADPDPFAGRSCPQRLRDDKSSQKRHSRSHARLFQKITT